MLPDHARRMIAISFRLSLFALVAAATTCAQQADAKPSATESPFSNLQYRFIGPPGNRVSAVVGEPGNSNVYYAGAASGGVWKSSDSGFHWHPIFDKQPAQSIGAIGIAPSNHNIV